MAESIMLEKAKDFAVNIVNLCRHIKETKRETTPFGVVSFWWTI